MKSATSGAELHLEFATHHYLDEDNEAREERYAEGNPASSIWPSVLDDRLDDYSPGALVVDSISSSCTSRLLDLERVQEIVWQGTPTGALAKRKSVLVAGADAPSFFFPSRDSYTLLDKYKGALTTLLVGGIGGAAIGGVAEGVLRVQDRFNSKVPDGKPLDPLIAQQQRDVRTEPSQRKVTRREFIRKGAMLGAFLHYSSGIAPSLVAPNLPTHKLDATYSLAYFSDMARRNGLGEHDAEIVDGRTALMIEKGLFLAELTGETTAVVMGNGHVPNSRYFLQHPGARAEAIKKLVIEYGKQLVRPFGDVPADQQPSAEAKLKLLAREIGLMSLYEVSRPYPEGAGQDEWDVAKLRQAVEEKKDVFVVPRCDEILTDLGIS